MLLLLLFMHTEVFLAVDIYFKVINRSLPRTVARTNFDHRRNFCGTSFWQKCRLEFYCSSDRGAALIHKYILLTKCYSFV